MKESKHSESALLPRLVELLRGAHQVPTPAELDRGLRKLRERLASASERRSRILRATWISAALTSCVALVLFTIALAKSPAVPVAPPVTMNRIEGGEVLDSGYLSESGHQGMTLKFSDGSQFTLDPGTRGRLRSCNVEGVRIALDRGVASVEITPSRDHRWWVEAGPFTVAVRGTLFSVSWDPGQEQLEVNLRRGSVAVSGPLLNSDLVMRAGERLSISLPKRETIVSKAPAHDGDAGAVPSDGGTDVSGSEPRASTISEAPPAKTSGRPELPAQSPVSSRSGRRWSEALVKGALDQILADVEHDGLEATLQSASSSDLFAIADAARYRRRNDWARAALLAHRERFPASPRSIDAAFLLGRVAESGNRKRESISWYDQYLARAPAGAYAADALGRKMIVTKELDGEADARRIAVEYLRRFPAGTYAGPARALNSE